MSARADSSRSASAILRDAGPTVGIPEAARVLGISRDLVYAMHHRGELDELGIRVLRLGSRLRVTTASLRRALGADQDGKTPRE